MNVSLHDKAIPPKLTTKQKFELANRRSNVSPYSERQLAALEHEMEASANPPPLVGQRGYASCRVYPNGEFGVGRLPAKKKTAEDERYDHMEVAGWKFYEEGRPHELEDGSVLYDITDKVQLASPKLGTVNELSQPHKKYGSTGITNYGKKIVRNAGFLMEEKLSKNILQMGTLTIPSFDEEIMLVICSNWAQLQKRFFEKCKRRYEKYRRPWMYVSVTEIQPRRWGQYRECGLHIHFIAPSYFLGLHGMYTLDDNWVREAWRQCISDLLSRKFPDGFRDDMLPTPNYRREKIKKSAAAYLAKYMSKGAEICQEVVSDLGEEWLPSQWWSASSNLKNWIKKRTIHTSGFLAPLLMELCYYDSEVHLHYSAPIRIETAVRGLRTIGYAGRLTEYGREFIDMAFALSNLLQLVYG